MMAPMDTNLITLYGIPNCDTVKKARSWLAAQGLDYQFVDFKKQGVPADRLDLWLSVLGWEALLNTRGTTWRRLDETTKASVTEAASARTLMLAHPSVIKRPLVEWRDGAVNVGFDATAWASRIG